MAINRAQKAPQIPQNWLKTQPNDHTSEFFNYLLIYSANINSSLYSGRFYSRSEAK
jgi:hypothetical protein